MSDRYIDFANSDLGRRVVGAIGLPAPVRLERWEAGRQRPIMGALLAGGSGALLTAIRPSLEKLTDAVYGLEKAWGSDSGPALKAIVFDASSLTDPQQLDQLRLFFQPTLKKLENCPHVVILGRPPASLSDPWAATTQRALAGFSRSLGKEIRHGGTVQLLYVDEGAEDQIDGALRFFLTPKSAFVSGQVVHLQACTARVQDWTRPLAGKHALVTGAARGIGAAIAETLARDGAKVILLDVAAAQVGLEALAARLSGQSLVLDIGASDAGDKLLNALPDGVDIVVHNAGITRDKTLGKMTAEMWQQVMAINLQAPHRLTQALLDGGKLHADGRVVLLASVSGIAGNFGQSNYATSKAGLIGLAEAWAPQLRERGISINAVAPGFIETHMTAAMPFTPREAGRRMSSLGQGGQPQDVAETVAWLSQPGSGSVTGQTLRVCGQSLLGA